MSLAKVADDLANRHGIFVDPGAATAVAGGDIHQAFRAQCQFGPVFVKLAQDALAAGLAAEADGLAGLAEGGELRVPKLVAYGASADTTYLVLEWLDFEPKTRAAGKRLGERLAALHRRSSDAFGWRCDNVIGRTPQLNPVTQDWADFFADARLEPQLRRAENNGAGRVAVAAVADLVARLHQILDHEPRPSLIHGDLWGGNWGVIDDDEPVVFDPAVHYADRECDLAMTRLFGGFDAAFYEAYSDSWPLPDGWERRQLVYQLYHVLNHFNLFGGGYEGQAASLARAALG